jgi:phosphomannomutase
LKLSIAGIRGAAGTALTPVLAIRLAAAFGAYLREGERPPRVILARDTRPSGPMLAAAVRSALLATGCDVLDLGVLPTPVMQWNLRRLGCDGGVAITAGHGPEHWNALKFIGPEGIFLDPQQGGELLDHFHHNRPPWAATEALGRLEPESAAARESALAAHRAAVLALVPREAIAARRFRVAVDLANGACCAATPALLEALGCEVIPINDEPDQPFPHAPEPNVANMAQLRAVVRAGKADIGFCHDADGDRLGLVTERAEPLAAAYTLALCAEAVLGAQGAGVVVANLSTSWVVDAAARRYGGSVRRVKVGQSFIAEGVHVYDALLGGEGSGGVMFPRLGLAQDSLAAMAHLLGLLAVRDQALSALVGELPRLAWAEERWPAAPGAAFAALTALREWAAREMPAEAVDLSEGVRLEWPGEAWVHVRSSLTEPILRLIGEGVDEEALRARMALVRGVI